MPLIMLKTTADVPQSKKAKIVSAMSKIVAEATAKPESYMMAILEKADTSSMAGKIGPVAHADVRAIGPIGKNAANAITKSLCTLLNAELDVPPESVYVNFTEFEAAKWGWKGETFG